VDQKTGIFDFSKKLFKKFLYEKLIARIDEPWKLFSDLDLGKQHETKIIQIQGSIFKVLQGVQSISHIEKPLRVILVKIEQVWNFWEKSCKNWEIPVFPILYANKFWN
jgi:hypothetical protein